MNKPKKRKPRLHPYRVNVCRIAYGNLDIEVIARNAWEASRAAEDKAGNYSFTEHSSEYRAQSATRIR